MKKRVGVLISGAGSNMQSLVASSRKSESAYEIACVVSNNPDAVGIAWAAEQGIPTRIIAHQKFLTRQLFDAALNDELQTHHLNLIACAGFMRVMTDVILTPWAWRMLNIHPSLLPKYTGLNTHQRALDAGDEEAGCSVHWVTAELDAGPVIAQASVKILASDTAQTLAARVLEQEHKLYPEVLQKIAEG